MNRSRGKSQVSIGIVLLVLGVISVLAIFGPTITGLFVGNFTIPINFTNVTEQVCHNETIETSCYNETVDVCRQVFNKTIEICENQTVCNYPETNETNINWTQWNQTYCSEELICYEQDIYSPVCHQEIKETCEERNITICENQTTKQYNFTLQNHTFEEEQVIFNNVIIKPNIGYCDENYSVVLSAYHKKGLEFSIEFWMNNYLGEYFMLGEVNVQQGTNLTNPKQVLFNFKDFCDKNIGPGSILIINTSYRKNPINTSITAREEEVSTQTFSGEGNCTETIKNLVSYNSGFIHLKGNGQCCNSKNPCTFDQLYGVLQEKEISAIDKVGNYYNFNAGLVVGDGSSDTSLVSRQRFFMFNSPVVVYDSGTLIFESSLIQTNVTKNNQLEKESAFLIKQGGEIYFRKSSYKIFSPDGKNNIYSEEGSYVDVIDFSMQRAIGEAESVFYLPSHVYMSKFNFVRHASYSCSSGEKCLHGVKGESG